MTTPIDPHPTKVKSKIFERYSWLPLVIAMLIGAFWVIAKFRTHKLQLVIFAVGVVLLLGLELLRWRRSRALTGEKLDSTTYIDGASSFSIGLIFGIGSGLIVIPLLFAYAQWVHSHAIFHVNDRLKDVFGGASTVVIAILLLLPWISVTTGPIGRATSWNCFGQTIPSITQASTTTRRRQCGFRFLMKPGISFLSRFGHCSDFRRLHFLVCMAS